MTCKCFHEVQVFPYYPCYFFLPLTHPPLFPTHIYISTHASAHLLHICTGCVLPLTLNLQQEHTHIHIQSYTHKRKHSTPAPQTLFRTPAETHTCTVRTCVHTTHTFIHSIIHYSGFMSMYTTTHTSMYKHTLENYLLHNCICHSCVLPLILELWQKRLLHAR